VPLEFRLNHWTGLTCAASLALLASTGCRATFVCPDAYGLPASCDQQPCAPHAWDGLAIETADYPPVECDNTCWISRWCLPRLLRWRAKWDRPAAVEPPPPPHSRFHPVPTRPVFEPRPEYPPPVPLSPGVVPLHLPPAHIVDTGHLGRGGGSTGLSLTGTPPKVLEEPETAAPLDETHNGATEDSTSRPDAVDRPSINNPGPPPPGSKVRTAAQPSTGLGTGVKTEWEAAEQEGLELNAPIRPFGTQYDDTTGDSVLVPSPSDTPAVSQDVHERTATETRFKWRGRTS